MQKITEFLKSARTSQNEVTATYKHIALNTEFTVVWNNIHPETGKIGSYDLQLDTTSINHDLAELVDDAIRAGETDDCPLYLDVRDTFDQYDCEDEAHTLTIVDTEFNVESTDENDEGYYIVCWLKIDAIRDGEDVEFSMQFDCGGSYELFDMDSNEITGELYDAIAETDCFDTLNTGHDDYIKELKLEDFKKSDHYEEVKALSKKVNDIMGDDRDYLILAKVFFEVGISDIGGTMISLQISCNMTQEQSQQVVDLF